MSEAKSESAESLAGTTPPAKTPPSKTPPSKTPPAEPSKQSVLRRYYPAAVPVILGLIIYFMPVPDGVDPKGMHMLGIFVGTIVALILQPLPTGSVALVGLSIAMITQTETPTEALSGFSNTTIWLIVASFFIAEGFLVTGLGKRVALMFVTKLGKSSLGLSYGMALTDLILAPATPSNTARAGGVVYPIIVSLSKLEDSNPEPEDSRKKLGAYLLLTSLQVNVVTSAMFITAMAGNPVAVDAAAKIGIDISWGKWALAASVPGIASLIAIPWVMSKIFPPTMLKTPKAPEQAREELRKAGPISRNEKIMAATFVLLLVLWWPGLAAQRQCHYNSIRRNRHPVGDQGADVEQPGPRHRGVADARVLCRSGRYGKPSRRTRRDLVDRNPGLLERRRFAVDLGFCDPDLGVLLRALSVCVEHRADRRDVRGVSRRGGGNRCTAAVLSPGVRLHRQPVRRYLALRVRSGRSDLRFRIHQGPRNGSESVS